MLGGCGPLLKREVRRRDAGGALRCSRQVADFRQGAGPGGGSVVVPGWSVTSRIRAQLPNVPLGGLTVQTKRQAVDIASPIRSRHSQTVLRKRPATASARTPQAVSSITATRASLLTCIQDLGYCSIVSRAEPRFRRSIPARGGSRTVTWRRAHGGRVRRIPDPRGFPLSDELGKHGKRILGQFNLSGGGKGCRICSPWQMPR
jgi:hypothetical protein